MAGSSKVPPEVLNILETIEVLLVKKRIGRREFERRIKLSGGALSRMFSGKLVLKVETLLAMLKVLEVTPLAFFIAVFSEDASVAGADDLYRKVQGVTLPEPQAPTGLSKEDVEKIVADAFSKLLHHPELSASAAPAKRGRRAKRPTDSSES